MRGDEQPITFADPEEARNFVVGMPLRISWPMPWRARVRRWISAAIARVMVGRTRVVVGAIDTDAGSVTLVTERWSRRRKRWERVA